MATGAEFFAQLEKRFNQLSAEEKLDKIVEYQKKLTALKEQGLSEEEAVARLTWWDAAKLILRRACLG